MKTLLLDCCTNAAQAVKTGMQGAATNSRDVEIVRTVCESIVWIVAIIAFAFLLWKLMEHYAHCCADTRRRTWELEDIKRKQNSDLISKKLEMLKELSYQPKKDAEKTPIPDNVNNYIAAIDEALKK